MSKATVISTLFVFCDNPTATSLFIGLYPSKIGIFLNNYSGPSIVKFLFINQFSFI